MASIVEQSQLTIQHSNLDYPSSDGRPMAETDLHRIMMFDAIEALKAHFAGNPVYVTGNLLVFYQPGDKRRHISPDCMVVKGVEPAPRLNYLTWEEGKSPDVVIEITSKTTRSEDIKKKFEIYRTILRVREYFLFDPTGDYLIPQLQGYRLVEDQYVPIEGSAGRLFSEELGLYLEGEKNPVWEALWKKRTKSKGPFQQLRLVEPETGRWLPTVAESLQNDRRRAEDAEQAKQQADAENARLLREVEELRRRLEGGNA
jgi:Uma2 family endonuclease